MSFLRASLLSEPLLTLSFVSFCRFVLPSIESNRCCGAFSSPELTCNWFVGFFYLFGLNLWQLCSSCHWWMEKLRWILKKVSRCVFSKWCLVQIIEQSCFYLYFYDQILTVASTDKWCLAASERNNKEVINNCTWWHMAAFNVEVTALNQIIRLFFSLLLYIFVN